MKQKKLTILFVLFICFGGRAQSNYQPDSVSKMQNLRINFQGALIANNSFSNLPKGQNSNNSYDYGYAKNNNKPFCFGFNAGVEFITGERKRFKQLFGITYDFTNSLYNDFEIIYSNPDLNYASERRVWNKTISRQVQFVNLNGGFLFNITKRLKLAAILSVAMYITKDITNGYYVDDIPSRITSTTPPYTFSPASYDSTVYKNTKTVYKPGLEASVKFRVSYDVTKYLSVFVSRNLGVSYHAPWWMLGLQFYPFKKFR